MRKPVDELAPPTRLQEIEFRVCWIVGSIACTIGVFVCRLIERR